MSGVELAKVVHEKGSPHLYLFSGTDFAPGELLAYLGVVPKTEVEMLKALVRGLIESRG